MALAQPRSMLAIGAGRTPMPLRVARVARRPVITAAAASPTSYTSPSSATGRTELDLLQACGTNVVPDAQALQSAAPMNAASVGFNILRVIVTAESLGLKPLEVRHTGFNDTVSPLQRTQNH